MGPLEKGFIRQKIPPIVQSRDRDENRAGLKGGAESRLAFAQARLAGPKFGLRFLSFADIVYEGLYHLAAAPFDSCQSHLQGDLTALRGPAHPFETRAAIGH